MRSILYRLRAWAAARRRAALAMALVAALALGLALTLVAGAARTLSAPDRFAEAWGAGADVTVEQASGAPRGDELAALPGVVRVEVATFVFGGLVGPDGQPADGLLFAGDLAPLESRVVEGRAAAGPRELVASADLAEQLGASLGDQVQVVTLTEAQASAQGFDAAEPEGPTVSATLVGLLGGPGEAGEALAVALAPASFLGLGDIGTAASVASVWLADGTSLAELRTQVDRLPGSEVFGLSPAEVVSSDLRGAVEAQGQGLGILALIVAVAVLAVVGQLLSRQLHLGADERSALRGLGYSSGQLAVEQAVRTAVVAGVGTLGALVLCYLASDRFPTGLARTVEPSPGRRLDAPVVALAAGLLLVGIVLWVVGALRAEGRHRPVPARPGLVERLVPALPSAPATTALRFAFARPTRSSPVPRVPVLGLVVVFAVCFGAVTFGANLSRLVDDPASYGHDFDLGAGQGGGQVAPEAVSALEASEDVAAFSLFGVTTFVVGSQTFDVVGVQPVRGDLLPQVLEGRLPVGDDEVALGPLAARTIGLGVGDELRGDSAGGPRVLRITGVALVPSVEGADELSAVALVTAGGLTRLDPASELSAIGIELADDVAPGARDRLSAAIGMQVQQAFDPPASVANLERVRGVPAVVALAVGALGVLSLAHLMLVAVRRRRRDLAVLRSLGASQAWLTRLVHWQATLTAAAVLLVAVPLGSLAGASLYRRFVERIGARPDSVLPIAWTLALLVAVLVLANLVGAVAARRARRDLPSLVLAAP